MIPVSFNKVLYVTPSYPDLSGVTTHLFLYNYHAVMARLIENDNFRRCDFFEGYGGTQSLG